MNISIKNNKRNSFLSDATRVYSQGICVGLIFRHQQKTGRRVHQGENTWDCFYVHMNEGYVAKQEPTPYIPTEKLNLGRRYGEDISVYFFKKIETLMGNITLSKLDNLSFETMTIERYMSQIPESVLKSPITMSIGIQTSWGYVDFRKYIGGTFSNEEDSCQCDENEQEQQEQQDSCDQCYTYETAIEALDEE